MNIKLTLLSVAIMLISCKESQVSRHSTLKVKCEEVKGVEQQSSDVRYPGKVSAAADVNLSFRVAGVIDRIVVKEGDFVRKDQVVAYMDSRDYKLQLEATEAQFEALDAEVGRIVALYEKQSVTENDYDKAVNGLKQMRSKLSAHRNALSDTELKAPFDGYVQRVNFDKGEAVSAGMPVIAFVSSSAPEVIVNIPAAEYQRRADLISAVATIAGDEQHGLQYIGIVPKANLNQLYEARFRVSPLDGKYPSVGISAMVTLNFKGEDCELTSLPLSSMVERDGASYVWLIENGVVKLTSVVVEKITSDGSVVISRGLSRGDRVVTAGVRTLKEGDRVEELAETSKSNIGNIL